MSGFFVLALLAMLLGASPAGADVDVTVCGQAIAPKEVAVLQVDLIGCASNAPALTLGDRAKLFFNGHSVSSGNPGIQCSGSCTLRGPGEITGAAGNGLFLFQHAKSKLLATDLDIHGNADNGIQFDSVGELSKAGRARLLRVTLRDNADSGMFFWQGILSGRDMMVTGNGFAGIDGLQKFKLKNLRLQNNARDGLQALWGGGRLIDSILSFNATQNGDADLATKTLPVLVNTECGFSRQMLNGFPWGVCSGDDMP